MSLLELYNKRRAKEVQQQLLSNLINRVEEQEVEAIIKKISEGKLEKEDQYLVKQIDFKDLYNIYKLREYLKNAIDLVGKFDRDNPRSKKKRKT